MKKQFILFCVTLIAAAPVCFAQASPAKPAKSASNQTAITDLEKSAWESYKNKQADAFRKLMSKDYYGTYAEGIKNLDSEVADMAKTDLREYSLADMKVVFPRADVAVVTYKTTIQMTSEGKDMSGTYNSGSIWVKNRSRLAEGHLGRDSAITIAGTLPMFFQKFGEPRVRYAVVRCFERFPNFFPASKSSGIIAPRLMANQILEPRSFPCFRWFALFHKADRRI